MPNTNAPRPPVGGPPDGTHLPPGPGECPPGVDPSTACKVYELVRLGSPRLALSVHAGVPLIPTWIPIIGDFASTVQDIVIEASVPNKVDQDTLITDLDFNVTNTGTVPPAGIDSINSFFFKYTSGIEVQMKVTAPGAGYNPILNNVPIDNVKRRLRDEERWLYSFNNSVQVTFQATLTPLPYTCRATVILKGLTSPYPKTLGMDPSMAIAHLRKAGYCVQDSACFV